MDNDYFAGVLVLDILYQRASLNYQVYVLYSAASFRTDAVGGVGVGGVKGLEEDRDDGD